MSTHEGKKFKEVMERHGKKVEDVMLASGKSRAMVYQYYAKPRFSAEIRDTLRQTLEKMRIDTAIIEEHREGEITDAGELRQLLRGIPDAALPAVKRIMKARGAERLAIEAIIEDRIERQR